MLTQVVDVEAKLIYVTFFKNSGTFGHLLVCFNRLVTC